MDPVHNRIAKDYLFAAGGDALAAAQKLAQSETIYKRSELESLQELLKLACQQREEAQGVAAQG